MRISLIVPAAGLYRHNERLWPEIAKAEKRLAEEFSPGIELETIVVTAAPPGPRLLHALKGIECKRIEAVVGSQHIGRLFSIGAAVATGDKLIFWHDDARALELADALVCLADKPGLVVPEIYGSHNPDQMKGACLGETDPITTRYIERAIFKVDAALYRELPADLIEPFRSDGYQVAIQWALAQRGIPAWVVPAGEIWHDGGATLRDLATSPIADMFRWDVKHLSAVFGVECELDSRPALPRIIPKGWLMGPGVEGLECGRGIVDEIVNVADTENYIVEGKAYKRIRCGHKYALPITIDSYDVALTKLTGLGDALMHTSALGAFKERFPHVLIRVYAYNVSLEVMRRCPAVDQALPAKDLPPSAVVWDVANGIEGTPLIGYNELGLKGIPLEKRRMYFEPLVVGAEVEKLEGPAVGIQLNGGWRSKRYGRFIELGRRLLGLGFDVRFFTDSPRVDLPPDLKGRHMLGKTPTLDHLAGYMRQLELWIGFDSGASYMANALGIPSVWLFATHNPNGLIGACGSAAPYEAIWRGWPRKCALEQGLTCRLGQGGAVLEGGACGIRHSEGRDGAVCIDDITPDEIIAAGERVMRSKHGIPTRLPNRA